MAFNKMFVMLPVMLAARKLDGEDPNIIFLLRCIYAAVQSISLLLILYILRASSTAASSPANKNLTIYVPPPPQPFEDPNAKKTYTEKSLSSHLLSSSRSLLTSTLFGILMTVGLHLWKGMIVGLAIQSVMAPFNLYENPLVKTLLTGGSLENAATMRIFGEKHVEEMKSDDLITDGEGNTVVLNKKLGSGGDTATSGIQIKLFEDVILDTWDLGQEADVSAFVKSVTKENANHVTEENGWTPIMVLSGLGAQGVKEAMGKMKDLGANPEIVDKEGWNALHWAAFHGSADAATILLDPNNGYNGITLGLHTVADKEGKTPIDLAREEKNDDVVKVIENALASSSSVVQEEKAADGVRKRK